MNWDLALDLIRQRPGHLEKQLFWVFIAVFWVFFLRVFIWNNYQRIEGVKVSVSELEKQASLFALYSHERYARKPTSLKALQNISVHLLHPDYIRSLKIVENRFSMVKQEAETYSREIQLSVEGTYHALEGYLAYLENMAAPLVIRKLEIKGVNQEGEILRMSVSGVVYASK
ncbi:MAG: hypothetical protein JKY15_00845 [Deltaproteobacteria bacterium]|nr:hypothetical protein [Deltaproteobacteria bacterium]